MTDDTTNPAVSPDDAALADDIAATDARLEALESEVAELRDQRLRVLAEMENLRRRTDREAADARQYAISRFALGMLSVADNLQRALASIPQEAVAAAEGALRALLDGVALTEREMLNQLETNGVRRIRPLGERFNPHFHQAMFEIPTADKAPGTVVDVAQDGFVIGDRVLRPALVGIAKAAPNAGGGEPNRVDRTV